MPKKQAKPKTNETKQQPKEETLETVLKAFNNSWDYTSGSWHDRWQNSYKLWNNERIKRGYFGISDTFVPMTFSTVETLTSALFGTKPKFAFLPPANKASQSTDILNGLLDHYWDQDQWSLKVINTGRGMIREGTAVDYFFWDVDHPRLINVPIRDFFIDPNAFELDERSTRYCGRRYLITLDELEQFEVVDFDKVDGNGEPTGEMKKKYKNLDKLKKDEQAEAQQSAKPGTVAQEQTTDKQEKDMFYGSTLNEPVENQIEVIEYWTVDRTISIANRKVVIEDDENIYKTKARANGVEYPRGILPFAGARDYVDGSLFYAKSDVDFIADQQEDLNDFSNQMKDAVSFNINQQKTLDPKYAHLLKEIQNLPGVIYPVEAGALVPVPNGQIPAEAFNERQNIKSEMRETTASNEIVKGAAQEGGKTTATEINAQIAGAGQRINLKVTQIENEYFHRVAKIVFKLIQLYVTEPMMVQILGKDGAKWEEFDPSEFDGEYQPRVQLDITIQNKKQQEAADAKEMLAAFLNDPDVNQKELKKLVLSRSFQLDPDEVDQLMTLPAGGAVDPMTGEPLPEGAPVDPMGMDGAEPTPEELAAMAAAMPEEGAIPEEDMMLEEDMGPSETDIVIDPATGEPVMAGELMI